MKRKHCFLTGEKQVGKSYLLRKIFEENALPLRGYETRPLMIEGKKKGYYLHGLTEGWMPENDSPIVVRIGNERKIQIPETFDYLGANLLKAYSPEEVLLMDEIGAAEDKAYEFQRAVLDCLDRQRLVLGVLQKGGGRLVQAIERREDVCVYEITRENRGDMEGMLVNIVREIISYGG